MQLVSVDFLVGEFIAYVVFSNLALSPGEITLTEILSHSSLLSSQCKVVFIADPVVHEEQQQ